jgi:phosphoribosylformimino-5-aminoimidazole carboxamide ribotide isomerase
LIGVIDLRGGQAVHARGGHRARYRPVACFRAPGGGVHRLDGDPVRLATGYRQAGLSALYVADLDALAGGPLQCDPLDRLADAWGDDQTLLLDGGFGGGVGPGRHDEERKWLTRWLERWPAATALVASESCGQLQVLEQLVERVGPQQVGVSLDYRDGRWLSPQLGEADWLAIPQRLKLNQVVALDVAAVGGGTIDLTLRLCQRLRPRLPDVTYISGGGVAGGGDAQRLIDAGVDKLLVASRFIADA